MKNSSEIKNILNNYKLVNFNKRNTELFLEYFLKNKDLMNNVTDFFNFDMSCLENFKIDLLNEGIPASVLKETFDMKIDKGSYINNIFIEDHKNKDMDEYMLKSQMIMFYVLFIKHKSNKGEHTKEELRDFILSLAMNFVKKIEYLEKTINYPKFTKIYNKYFSCNENENIQFVMKDSIIIGVSAFSKIGLIDFEDKEVESIIEYLNEELL